MFTALVPGPCSKAAEAGQNCVAVNRVGNKPLWKFIAMLSADVPALQAQAQLNVSSCELARKACVARWSRAVMRAGNGAADVGHRLRIRSSAATELGRCTRVNIRLDVRHEANPTEDLAR